MPTNPKTEPRSGNSSSSKHLEIKLNGIPELKIKPGQHSPVKRMEHEKHLETILETIGEWDMSSLAGVKRPGPFKQNAPRPRSLLVTFKNAWTAGKCLMKGHLLRNHAYPGFICKSLTKYEETIEKRLLKKRWDLIQTNIPREKLKIRNLKLYHNDIGVPLES